MKVSPAPATSLVETRVPLGISIVSPLGYSRRKTSSTVAARAGSTIESL
jgi:hypothetical protein